MPQSDRAFIRHPSDIPIEFSLADVAVSSREYLNNISVGGLSFRSKVALKTDSYIAIRIPFTDPVFSAIGRVVWSRQTANQYYDVGVAFTQPDDHFKARMVEQICHIEHYKRKIAREQNRHLSGEAAALEWIKKYAPHFPD
jgi:hypothetical protein